MKNKLQNFLTFKDCFVFPIATPEARKDLFVGSLLLFTLLFGWVCNLGHRLDVVYRIYHRTPPYYRGFFPLFRTFLRGLKAFGAIAAYLLPSAIFGTISYITYTRHSSILFTIALTVTVVCFIFGVFSLPGGMTYNAAFNDISYLYRPDKAFSRAREAGVLYLKAWIIGLSAILLSFLGLFALGIGFFFTSVWAWMVVGYAFSQTLALKEPQLS